MGKNKRSQMNMVRGVGALIVIAGVIVSFGNVQIGVALISIGAIIMGFSK